MKRQSFFGKVRHATTLTCGYDAGYDDEAVCSKRAEWHGWAGTPPDTKLDGAVFACEEHFQILTGKLWDFHDVGGACGIPGAIWFSGTQQGQGCCKHDLDFESLTAAHVEPLTLTASSSG